MSALPVLPLSQLPKWTFCANDPDCLDNRRRPREEAAQFRLLAVNPSARIDYLVFDCDHDDDERYRIVGLPAPSWIAASPRSGRYHIAWRLATPVLTGAAARLKPVRFLAGVAGAIGQSLNADPGYTGLLTKNPLRTDIWKVQDHGGAPVELTSLADRVGFDISKFLRKPSNDLDNYLGRNCQLFDWLRYWAYENKASYGNQVEWNAAVGRAAQELNSNLRVPLQQSEVKSITKSVAKWVWNKYSATMSPKQRMVLKAAHQRGALIAAAKYRQATDTRVQSVLARMLADKEPVSITRLAAKARCHKRVARRVLGNR